MKIIDKTLPKDLQETIGKYKNFIGKHKKCIGMYQRKKRSYRKSIRKCNPNHRNIQDNHRKQEHARSLGEYRGQTMGKCREQRVEHTYTKVVGKYMKITRKPEGTTGKCMKVSENCKNKIGTCLKTTIGAYFPMTRRFSYDFIVSIHFLIISKGFPRFSWLTPIYFSIFGDRYFKDFASCCYAFLNIVCYSFISQNSLGKTRENLGQLQ